MQNHTTPITLTTATGFEIKNAKTFVAKFLPCTNTKGARVKIFSPVKGHKGKSLTLAWNYALSEKTYEKAFTAFLAKHHVYFFDLQMGETFEVTKSYFDGGYYFTARVAR
jgi:hypothetical protein